VAAQFHTNVNAPVRLSLAADSVSGRMRSVVEGPTCRAAGYQIGMTEANRTEMRGRRCLTPQCSATLEANSEIAYNATITTNGVAAIKWPIKAAEAVLSENDRRRQRFSAFAFSFRYDVR